MTGRHILGRFLAALAFLALASCGTSGGGEGGSAQDYVFGCRVTIVNETGQSLVEYTWILYEEDPGGDIGWDTGTETIDPAWLPAEEHTVVLGPGIAVTDDTWQLVWRLRLKDATDVVYEYDVPIGDCGDAVVHVAP